MQLKKLASLWLPAVLWMGFIYYLSSKPGLAIGEGAVDFWTRKPAHIGEYAILFLLLFRALRGSSSLTGHKLYLASVVFTFLYGVTDEVHQVLVPLREGRILDLGFDLLGILAGFLVLRYLAKKSSNRSKF